MMDEEVFQIKTISTIPANRIDPGFIEQPSVQIVSDDSVLVKTCVNDSDEWKWFRFPENGLKELPISSAKLCAVSPNQSILLANFLDRLWFVNVENGQPLGTHGYPDDCEIYHLFWITDDIAYIVTSAGLLMFQPSDTDSLTRITDYDDSIDPKFIYNVQLDVESGFYVLQMRKDDITRIQYGSITSVNWTVKDGSAACLFAPKNCFLEDITCISYIEQVDRSSGNCVFQTEVLKGESELKTSTTFILSPDDGTPLLMHCDATSCLATVTSDNGRLLLFDALNGMRIGSSDTSLEVIALRNHSEGGFLFLHKQNPKVHRCSIQPSSAIRTYQRIANTTIEPFHLACRYDAPNTNCETVRQLVDALFFDNTKKSKELLLKAVGTLTAESMKSFKQRIHRKRALLSIKQFIGSQFTMGETVDWLSAIHQWCEDFCNQPQDQDEFLCFDDEGGVDIDATIDVLEQDKRDISPVKLFQMMKGTITDPFDRAKMIIELCKRKDRRDEMMYYKMAKEMQENNVRVGDEYWEAILEEAFEKEEVRSKAEQHIRQHMY